ncbi:MAG: hypothetical protein ACE5HQ_02650 [Gemmatimonadota bacterium]
MSDRSLLIILAIPLVLAFAFGWWAGLGFPGLYGKHEFTGKASRRSPFQRLVDRVVTWWDHR